MWLVRKFEKSKPKLILEDLTLEEKLQQLAKVGIKLLPGFSTDYFLTTSEREKYEAPGFDLLLFAMGGDEESDSFSLVSDSLYHFDLECIEGDGSYVEHIERIAAITNGKLHITNLIDRIDYKNEIAWVEFECNHSKVHIEAEYVDDWFDPNVVACLAALLNKEGDKAKLYQIGGNEGQDVLIGCLSPENAKKLASLGVEVAVMDDRLPLPRCTIEEL